MWQRILFSTLLILWLASCASADGGDDFANNLASDLGPIIALFGERVVMQFMSQAMGIADCILLAVAPIGAITTVVSAIRVAGPTWLKSFIGRARENLAAAEVEVMSSTSKETCELWNGHRVVRCPGSADIYQFFCLIPKGYNALDLAGNGFKIRYKSLKDIDKKLKDIKANTKTITEMNNRHGTTTAAQGTPTVETVKKSSKEFLQQIEKTGPKYIWQFFKSKMKRTRSTIEDIEKSHDSKESNTTTGSEELLTPHIMPPLGNITSKDSNQGKGMEMVIITDDLDDGAPNLLLNCHDRVGRSEIYLAAALGIILQLGAVLYFGVITYHKPIQNRFLKDGNSIVKYAFPCAAVGTFLLVLGLFICSWVVGESTAETYYKAENYEIFVVWLQKDHTVSDQVFRPYAIYPATERDYITISRRNIKDRPKEIRNLCRNMLSKYTKSDNQNDQKTNNRNNGPAESENEAKEQRLYWPLKFITVVGSFISLIGFISQFIGMRGLNWTASIVQLGITIVVTILRVIVRRGLGKTPNRTDLKPKFELDWFVLSIGNLATAHWVNYDKNSNNLTKKIDDSGNILSSKWEICTGGEQTYLPLQALNTNSDTDSNRPTKDSLPHQIMLARKNLGKSCKWQSPVLEEAISLSGAIGAVANSFFSGLSATKYEWSIPAIYRTKIEDDSMKLSEDDSTELVGDDCMKPVKGYRMKSAKGTVYISITKDKNGIWGVDEAEIEAILSLWVYSTSSTDISKASRPRSLRVYGPSECEQRLIRDLEWWMHENVPKIYKYSEEEVAKLTKKESFTTKESSTNKESDCTIVGFRTEHGIETMASNEPIHKYLILECQDKRQKLFSRDLFFSFMRAVAKMPEIRIASASNAHPLSYSTMIKGWKKMKLEKDIISDLARKLEKIGFGTLSDIYTDLIIPLSLEQKLTDVKNIIGDITKKAYEYERSLQWKQLVDTCICLLDLALQFDLEKESSGALAIAVCLGFLYRLDYEAKLQRSERRIEDELTTQLEKLKEAFTHEKVQSSAYFSAILQDKLKFFAMSLSKLAGSNYNSATPFPDSFQIAAEHFKVIHDIELGQLLVIEDFKAFEKIDAFGWSPLHYAANSLLRKVVIVDNSEPNGDLFNHQDLMGWTPLHHACLCGNEEVVNMLLKHGTSIEIAGEDGITPMHCAIQSGKTKIIEELTKEINSRRQKHTRKSVSHVDSNERYPIHWAAVEGNMDMVRLMKDDINVGDRFGWTPLHLATIHKHKNLLQNITKDYAETINISDNESRTPLHLAVKYELIDAVQILLDAGAKINTTAKNGSTPLHEAMNNKQMHIVRKLLKKEANLEALDMEGRTPFYLAVENKSIHAVQILLEAGTEINTAAKNYSTPLHVAVQQKQEKILNMLLEHGADKEAMDMEGRTPLYLAVEDGMNEIINLLIHYGAQVKTAAKDGRTPLHVTLSRGEEGLDVAKILLQAGADANTKAEDGATVLHVAAQCGGLFGIINMLADKDVGLNIDATDEYGQTPLLIAIYEKDWEAAKLLLDMNASIDVDQRDGYKPLLGAVIGGNEDILQQLLNMDANTEDVDEDGYSALHLAVLDGKQNIMQMLLNAGADIDAVEELMNETPLHIAVRKGHTEIVQILLDRGATTILFNSRGFSPLQHALYIGDLPMLQRLIEHDKKSTRKAALQKNEEGDTPLHTLARWGKDDGTMCKMLDELLSIGPEIEINAKNNERHTPLYTALFLGGRHRLFITKLRENGADWPEEKETIFLRHLAGFHES